MTDRKGTSHPAVAWIERGSLALLLALTVAQYSRGAETDAKVSVIMSRQEHFAKTDEARATHEARIKVIESNRFTHLQANAMRADFDGQLLDLWRELHVVKSSIPVAHDALRDRLEGVMGKLEARIRAIENPK